MDQPAAISVDMLTDGTLTTFEGADHGSQSSFYISRDEPGEGPALHVHPYSETFIVEEGRVRFTVDDRELEVGPGSIVVVPPDTPHRFTSLGPGAMRSINIHAAARMEQRDL